MNELAWSFGGATLTGTDRSSRTEPCFRASLSTSNAIRIGLEVNPSLCGERTESYRPKNGTILFSRR